MSAESAALCSFLAYVKCAAPSVLSPILFAYPGLTAGPIDYRPFGPDAGGACVMIWNTHAGFAQASTSKFDFLPAYLLSAFRALKSKKYAALAGTPALPGAHFTKALVYDGGRFATSASQFWSLYVPILLCPW
jgi:hypothetical protein